MFKPKLINSRTHQLRTICCLLLIALLALGFSWPWGKKEAKEIKIGVITPLTGDGATYGMATKRGLDLAAEEINNKGGIKGKKLKLIYEDDQMKPEMGINAINKLIHFHKVPVIIGAFGSTITLSIAPIAESNKVVLFSASSTADEIKDAGDYIFRNVPPNSLQGRNAAEFAAQKLNAKTATILYMNNDYGITMKKAFEKSFIELGGKILLIENYNQGDKDFRTQLSKKKEKQPDVIFYPGHYQESGLILKQAKELGIKATFIGGDGSYSPELTKIAGEAAENSYYTLMAMGYGIADNEITKFVKSYKQKYKEAPDVYSAYAYDSLNIIAEAIKKGGYSAEGIKSELYKINGFCGVTGITSFDGFGEANKPFYIYSVRDGKFVLHKNEN